MGCGLVCAFINLCLNCLVQTNSMYQYVYSEYYHSLCNKIRKPIRPQMNALQIPECLSLWWHFIYKRKMFNMLEARSAVHKYNFLPGQCSSPLIWRPYDCHLSWNHNFSFWIYFMCLEMPVAANAIALNCSQVVKLQVGNFKTLNQENICEDWSIGLQLSNESDFVINWNFCDYLV